MLNVARSSVSIWVRDIELSSLAKENLASRPFTDVAIAKRRDTRLLHENAKREAAITDAKRDVSTITFKDLWLIGIALYWAEGGKTQRLVRFSNGDPRLILIMMRFFGEICGIQANKFRGYIHIHPDLNHIEAENYWSQLTGIPLTQFFKTYRTHNKSSQGKKTSLPYGVLDVYILDTSLFLRLMGWMQGIYEKAASPSHNAGKMLK